MSASGKPLRPITIESVVNGDPVRHRAPYTAMVQGSPIRFYHGEQVLVGTEKDPNSEQPTAVSFAVSTSGCNCGCGATGRAIEFIPTPEHARWIAQRLLEAADEVEAAAKSSAAALLARAARK